MFVVVFSFLISLLMVKVIIYTNDVHSKVTLDSDTSAIQKMHEHSVPRIGGLAIFVSITITTLYGDSVNAIWSSFYSGLIVASFFVFIGGITEDLSKSVSPAVRMLFMITAVVFAVFISHSMPMIKHFANENIDYVLGVDALAFMITCFAVVGISNSFNIIDGYNGLSATATIVNTLALAYLSWKLNDHNLMIISLSITMAVFGFLVFNYPYGKIFLGDGGSYTIGFIISLISINLIEGHIGQISPFAVLLLVVYPFTETVFTIFRRKIIHKTKATQPDNLHLHQLIFDRCLPHNLPLLYRNSRIMPLMLMFILPQSIFCIVFYNNTRAILFGIVAYVCYYVYLYWRLATFRTPKYLILKAGLLTRKYK